MAQYATRAELALYGLPPTLLAGWSNADQDDALAKASGMFDAAVDDCITVPLTAPYPAAVAVRVCHVASYLLIRQKWNPELDADDRIVKDYEAAIAWWDGLCESGETIPGTTPVDPGDGGGALIALGDDPRGW